MDVQGSSLQAGDTIEVWWAPNRDTITELKPYNGPLKAIFEPEGARIASFALNGTGMTIEGHMRYKLICRTHRETP